jgi:hypothetical protein
VVEGLQPLALVHNKLRKNLGQQTQTVLPVISNY